MYQRNPPSYAYDDQTVYTSGQHGADYTNNGYPQQHQHQQPQQPPSQGSAHYYAAPAQHVGNVQDGPYFRSMTPSLVSSNRYPTSRDPRYYNHQGYGGSSSSQQLYPSQHQPQQYPSQYLPTSDQRSVPLSHTPQPQPQFIPTPSEIAHSYNYPHQMAPPRSPTVSDDAYSPTNEYGMSPSHMVPSHGSQPPNPRLSRLVTGRPSSSATSTSPISASSPSGERFPCEKCGKTFSRSHDRKRHHETQHLPTPVLHICPYCSKEFSRNDSLKRHLDNGCDEMHS